MTGRVSPCEIRTVQDNDKIATAQKSTGKSVERPRKRLLLSRFMYIFVFVCVCDLCSCALCDYFMLFVFHCVIHFAMYRELT